MSAGDNEIGGMRLPGLMLWALLIQPARFPVVLGTVAAPIVVRLPNVVRSGPIVPWAWVARTVWQPAHASRVMTSSPRAAASSSGGDGACRWRATQRA